METVGRFAPSPSGRLHLGNLLCALLVWLSARQKDGRVLLRVEDLDTARCPRRYSEQMERDLQWLGLDWDIGPGRDNGTGPYYQSQRTEIYQAALETLREKGLVYPCFCTRAELHAASAPHREDGQVVYAGTCRRLTAADCGDFLLRRSDGMFAYQLAVVVDDAAMGVTEVVRGADLLDSTPRQLYLYYLLGLTPPVFYHFPLLLTAAALYLARTHRPVLGGLCGAYAAFTRSLGLLLIVPLLLGLLLLPLGFIPQEIRLVVLLLMAAPSAAMCTLQCQKHSMNDAYASHIFAVTTLVSMLTMPLVVKLFTWAAEKF